MNRTPPAPSGAPVTAALASCRGAFAAVGLFSGLINLLMLSGSFYMLQIYDRVLSSRSIPTLVGISLLLLACYALQGFLDAIRIRMLARIGARFNALVSARAFATLRRSALLGAGGDQAMQPVRDLDQIRAFLASMGPTALFDMPWMPLFFAGCFLLNPWLGWLAMGGGIVILALTWLTERRSRAAGRAQFASAAARQAVLDACRRNAEAVTAMGMMRALRLKWRQADQRHVHDWLAGSDATSGIGAIAKVFRMLLQSLVLGLGAYLSIRGEISGGSMIAASIMTSRALAPIEIAMAHWKQFVAARQGLQRLGQVLDADDGRDAVRTALPAPCRELVADNLVVAAPGRPHPILLGASLRISAGQGLAVIGPSASGKSTLARALVGVWQPLRGDIRLDGASIDQWEQDELGRHVGYLPQAVELLDGTVAENIARFAPDAPDAAIIAAAKAAGAHDLIVGLEHGYDTPIGEAGASLSGGQRQRIGLARALFGDPFLVVLDEPNSNLDHEGDAALTQAVQGVRARGGIAVIVTHRQSAMAGVDHVAMMAEGRILAIGPKADVLQKMMRQGGAPATQRQAVA